MRRRTAIGLLAAVGLLLGGQPRAAEDIGSAKPQFEGRLRRAIAVKGDLPEHLSLSDRMAHYKVPGLSVAIIEGCEIVQTRYFGVTDSGGTEIGLHTLFQAASITKPVTALAALRLVEQGKLSLDADVRTRLKTWTLPDSPLLQDHPVTLRTLLSHSAGLNVGGFRGYAVGTPLPTVSQILDGVAPANNDPVRVQTAPGSRWKYSGGGFVIAQLLMTEATGRPFPALMRDLVLTPVGMTDSTYEVPLPERFHAKAAAGHLIDGEPVPGKWHVYPEMGAASLWSTPRDLARFAIAVIRADQGAKRAIIERATAADMLKAQIAHRGLGWVVGGEGKARSFSHGGTNEGYGAQMIAFPETCQGAVVLTNADGGRQLTDELIRAIADTYRWPDPMPSTEREGIAITSAMIKRFAGTYRPESRPDRPFDIVEDGAGGLTLIWTRWPAEPLRASPDGLFALDSGATFKVKEATDALVQSLTYGADNNSEAKRVAP